MKTALESLKKHIISLAFAIACSVIVVMLIVLNAAMNFSYSENISSASGIISQAAFRSVQDITTEDISLSEIHLDSSGDYVFLRNPLDIASITLHGTITCSRPDASWYSAGGGVIIKALTKEKRDVYFYQEYSFSKDVREITIDFPAFDRMKNADHDFEISETEICDDIFMLSKQWWASSDKNDGDDSDVALNLDRISIKYKDNISITDFTGRYAVIRSYSDTFDKTVPQNISSLSSFYLVTDRNNNLIEINRGNLVNTITEGEAHSYLEESLKNQSCVVNGLTYKSTAFYKDDAVVRVFLCESDKKNAMNRLGLYSVLIGITVAVLIFLIIYYASAKMVEKLSQSYEKQNQFIANASHELKTPITVISATTDILMRKNGSDDKWLETIKAQSDKMQKLVHEMLELTKMNDSIDIQTSFGEFDISQAAENTVLYFEGRAYEEHRQLESDIQQNITVNGCEEKIEELLGILLDNALKYSDENGTINLSLSTGKNNVIFKCSNPCRDFNPNNTDRLFERFYRSDESHSDEKDGFGLGLSIAQLIVMKHKGKINVSYENGIVTFSVILPK